MSSSAQPFSFSQFVPGFDFLKNLAAGAADPKTSGLSGLPNWVAPTLSVEEIDKRIKELKTVQFWLEQNLHALKATIQALEVQRMTLATLEGMNVHLGDLAKAFTPQAASALAPAAAARRATAPAPAPTAAPAPAPAPEADAPADAAAERDGSAAAKSVVDPLQWWSALSEQFTQIASTALQEASQLKMPAAVSGAAKPARGKTSASKKTAAPRAPAKKAATRRRSPPATRR